MKFSSYGYFRFTVAGSEDEVGKIKVTDIPGQPYRTAHWAENVLCALYVFLNVPAT